MFLVGCCNKPDQQDKYILTELAFVYTIYIYIHIYIYTLTHMCAYKNIQTQNPKVCLLLSPCVRHKVLWEILLPRDKACKVLSTSWGLASSSLASGPFQCIFTPISIVQWNCFFVERGLFIQWDVSGGSRSGAPREISCSRCASVFHR